MQLTRLLFAMCLIAVIRLAVKADLSTGRIYQQRWCVHDPTPQHPAGREGTWPNFSRSDWIDLNDLCHRSGLQLKWVAPDGSTAALSNIITDPLIHARATYVLDDGAQQELSVKTARASILRMKRSQSAQHWISLSLQGKLAHLPFANHSWQQNFFYRGQRD